MPAHYTPSPATATLAGVTNQRARAALAVLRAQKDTVDQAINRLELLIDCAQLIPRDQLRAIEQLAARDPAPAPPRAA
jgi:hypothetical protein